jgi:hypothetical protein
MVAHQEEWFCKVRSVRPQSVNYPRRLRAPVDQVAEKDQGNRSRLPPGIISLDPVQNFIKQIEATVYVTDSICPMTLRAQELRTAHDGAPAFHDPTSHSSPPTTSTAEVTGLRHQLRRDALATG